MICAIIIIPIFINGDKPAPSLKAEMEEIAESEAAERAAVPRRKGLHRRMRTQAPNRRARWKRAAPRTAPRQEAPYRTV